MISYAAITANRATSTWGKLASVLVAFAICVSAAPALAQSGEFTFVFGSVTIERAAARITPIRGTTVGPQDVIVTGADGMAQLSMVDGAKLSLRSNSQLLLQQYPVSVNDPPGVVLSLVRGTLRTFTTALTGANRAGYKLNTRIATVGIRGSGGILEHQDETTNHHTIEGSHEIASVDGKFASIISLPNQTVQVVQGQAPKLIPTPASLLQAGSVAKTGKEKKSEGESEAAAQSAQSENTLATVAVNAAPQASSVPVFTVVDPSGNLGADPLKLQNIVIAAGGSVASDIALPTAITLDANGSLRAYTAYVASQSGTGANVVGGLAREVQSVSIGGGITIVLGRWEGVSSFGFGGGNGGIGSAVGGSVHWAYGGAGYPSYLSDVLTGTSTYTRQAATTPTNQFGTIGTLTTATLDVNFTARTLNAVIGVTMPAGGGGAGNWNLAATNVPFSQNAFFASGSRVTVTNASGTRSTTNPLLGGSIEGSFIGANLNGAILGYSIFDRTRGNSADSQRINGVVAYSGPAQNSAVNYRDGLVSDPSGSLGNASYIRSFATSNRQAEVTVGDNGAVTAFSAPFPTGIEVTGHLPYARGTAVVVDSGFDPTTGLVWGRWAGGVATVGGQSVSLAQSSLHYIFSPTQSGPVSLPLTGAAVYDVVGSTRPTDQVGHVGVFNSASLSANFSARTVDASVNITINGQTWNGAATAVPIYRDQYFSAYAGGPTIAGLPRPPAFNVTCTPNCTPNGVIGSIDGFFSGRRGAGAGVMYNMNNNAGVIAFLRRGG